MIKIAKRKRLLSSIIVLTASTGCSLKLVGLLLALCVQLLALPAQAHDLEVDTLSIRLESGSRKIAGQLMLDPDLTRPEKEQVAVEDAKAEVIAFAKSHVTISSGKKPVPLLLEVRELYEKGGAVPGDSIIFTAVLPDSGAPLSVSLRPPLERIVVTASIDTVSNPAVLVTASEPVAVTTSMRSPSAAEGAPTGIKRAPERATWAQVLNYVWTGVVHIIPLGWDHILFVLALTLGSRSFDVNVRNRRLLVELTAFTLAHTLTLALGALQVVDVPAKVVEPLIALSISAVALEHLLGWKDRWARGALVGFFGLVHGLGFAGVLGELGLSGPSFLVFLASFNLGVEVGQLAVVLLALLLFWILERFVRRSEMVLRAGTWAIALLGLGVGVARLL